MKKFTALLAAAALCLSFANFAFGAASAWVVHDGFKLRGYNGSNLNIANGGNTLKVVLCSSSSNAATTSVNNYASLTNELSTANGYTAGGYTVTQTWTGTSTVTFTIGTATWTASGGSITARFGVLYNDTDSNKTVIAHTILDNTPADVTVTTGNTLTITGGTVYTLAKVDLIDFAMVQMIAANDPFYVQRITLSAA